MEADDAQKSQDVQGLQPKGEYDHTEAADEGNGQVGEDGDFAGGGEIKIIEFRTDEDRGNGQERPGAFEKALSAFTEEEIRKQIAYSEKDIEFHPVGDHTQTVDVRGQEVEAEADEKLSPVRNVQFHFEQQVDDSAVKECGEIPELVQEFGLGENKDIIMDSSVRIGIAGEQDLEGDLDGNPDQVGIKQIFEFTIE